jgi:hypothetical protein
MGDCVVGSPMSWIADADPSRSTTAMVQHHAQERRSPSSFFFFFFFRSNKSQKSRRSVRAGVSAVIAVSRRAT